MRSQLPDLYRSLEKGGSAKGYDAIAMAASLNFLAIPAPSSRQCDAFSRLIEPLWVHLADDTRAHIANRLAAHHTVPDAISDLLSGTATANTERAASTHPSQEKTEATAAEQVSSPVSISDMQTLAERRSPVAEPERTAKSAADARATLRALVARSAAPKPSPQPILQIAQSRDHEALRDHLAENLSLSRSDAEALLEPDNLPDLSMALRALGLATSDAMTVLMFVDQTVAKDMVVFAIAKNHYNRLTAEAAAAHFGQEVKPAAPTPSLQPTSADLLTPIRSTSPRRAEFGRRSDNQNRRTGTRN